MIAVARRSLGPAAGAALAVAGVGLLYAGVLGALLDLWLAGSYYSYIVLVPLFSGWLVWEARHRLTAARAAWWWPGLAVAGAGIALRIAGDAAGSLSVEALSLPVTLAGLALVGLGPARFGVVAFPIAFLAFLTPLPEVAIPRLSQPLQWLAADGAAAGLRALGIPFERDGLFLHLQPVTLHISEACNGLRFLLAMIVLSVAFAGAVLTRTGPRLLLLVSGVALALAANQVRVTGTAVLAHAWGADAATGLFHIAWGKVVYVATLVPFAALALRLRPPRAASDTLPLTAEVDGDGVDDGPRTVSVAIPTKGRPEQLAEAAGALLAQTRHIDELIVVDQSADDQGRRRVTALVDARPADRRPRLVYVRDPSISGAAAARNTALELFRGDVVVFCDDDVLPAPDAIEALCRHYRRVPWLAGVAPVIVNYDPPPWTLRLFLRVFLRGPFRDERQPIYWFWRRHPPGALLPVRMFTGAMMSFRRATVAGVRMDPRFRGPSTGEDVDLCWTLVSRGARLAIATDARIVHRRAPRPLHRPEATLLTSWAYLYDRHVPKTLPTRAAFAWYVVGIALNGLQGAVRERSLAPLRSLAAGLHCVASDYDGCPFLAPPRRPRRR